MANESNEAIVLKTKEGEIALTKGGEPEVGSEILLLKTNDGYITHGTSPDPEVGDEGIVIPTSNGQVYVAPGELCNPNNTGYWKWYDAGIDTSPFQEYEIRTYDFLWSSPEFKGIKFDLMIQGHFHITAFGHSVVNMDTPLDEEYHAVPYHFVAEYYNDNPCYYDAVRLILDSIVGRPYASISGKVEISIGRRGFVGAGVEVVRV